MKKNLFRLFGVLFCTSMYSQVGINTVNPDKSAMLDVTSSNKGFLPPRVNLTSVTLDLDGVTGQAVGLLIYNQGTNLPNGYYYWDGSVWRRLTIGFGVSQNLTFVTGNRTSLNPYIVQDEDYYIFLRLTGTITGSTTSGSSPNFLNTNYNIQLPNPALYPGREIYFINDSDAVNGGSSGVHAYTNYPIYGLYDNDVSSDYSTNNQGVYLLSEYYSKMKIISDGVRWIAVQITIV